MCTGKTQVDSDCAAAFLLAEAVDLLVRSSEIEGSLRNLKALTVVQVSLSGLRGRRKKCRAKKVRAELCGGNLVRETLCQILILSFYN